MTVQVQRLFHLSSVSRMSSGAAGISVSSSFGLSSSFFYPGSQCGAVHTKSALDGGERYSAVEGLLQIDEPAVGLLAHPQGNLSSIQLLFVNCLISGFLPNRLEIRVLLRPFGQTGVQLQRLAQFADGRFCIP